MSLYDEIISNSKKKKEENTNYYDEIISNSNISKKNSKVVEKQQSKSETKISSSQNNQLSARENFELAKKDYKKALDKHGEEYQNWKNETRKNDNFFEKTLGVLDDMFWGGDRRYYNQKYKSNELKEAEQKLKEAQNNYEQSIIDNKEKSSIAEKVVLPIAAGADNFVQSAITNINKVASVLPGQSMENYNSNPSVIQRDYQKAKSETANPLMKVYQDLAYTTSNMAPAIAMPGTKSALLTTAANAFGSSYNQARQEGKTDEQATKYGLLSGSSEALLQKALGGISSVYGKSLLGKKLGNVTDKALSKLIKSETVRKLVSDSGSEFTEEYLQTVLEPVFRNLAFDENNEIKLVSEEALYSGFLGALNSGLINSANLVTTNKNQNNINSQELEKTRNTSKIPLLETNSIVNDSVNEQKVVLPTEQNNNLEIKPETNIEEIKLPKTNTNQEVNVQENLEKLSTKNNINLSKPTNVDSDIFSKQVDEVVNGTFPERDMLVVSQNTPQILQDIGLNNLPITMTQKHLNTIMNSSGQYKDANYHDLGIDIVKQLPSAIADPLNVLKSNTKDDSIVVVTDLADNQERPIIASIKIDGTGRINDIFIDTNVMTSAYGRNNYDQFMQDNIAKGNLLYDIDEGIIKRSDGKLQLRPTTSKKESSTGGKVQFPTISNTRDRVQFPMRGNSISYDNNTTNSTKSQVASLPSQYSMQQNVKNDTKISNKNENKTAQLLDKRPSTAKPTLQDSAYKTIRELVDKGEAISRLAKKTGNKELYAKYDHMGTAEAEGNYAIAVAQTDNKGNKIGKSIIEIWQPAEDAGLVEEFSNYLLHKHNIARWQQGKPVFGEEITSDISQKFVEESEKKYPQFNEWSKDINTYNKNQMQNMVDAGLTSKESQEYLNSTYDNYVRIYRDVRGNSPITQFRGNLKVNVPIKKAKGGNQDILPLKDSMAQQTIEIKKAIRRNEFGLELLNVLDNGQNVEYDGKQTVVKNDDGTYSFTVFKDGQPVKMEIDEGIYEALEPKKTHNFEKTLPFRAIQKVSQIQRGLLTDKNPLFIATNFFKDIGDAPFNSKYASKFTKNYVVAANEIKNNGELWNKYRALGGEQNTYFDYESGVKLPSNSKASKFIRKIQNINHVVEQLPRFTEFISTLEAGGTEAQAMYNAAEITTNFKRGGDTAKALNRNGANFLNASIQGFDKQIRNFSGQNGAKGYVNLLAKATVLGILPSVLNHLLLDDDDDYRELPDYVKDSYFLFKTGDGKFIRIPKGRVVSTFGMAARRTLEYTDGEKDAYDGMFTQIANQVAPNNPLEDNVYAPIKSVMTNKSWNGSEIVPTRLQDELPENQYDEKTDAISKFIGKTFKVSPKKVNYLLDQYTGAIGDIALPYLTPQARQNPISAKFTTDSVLNNKNVSDFYDIKDELTAKSNSTTATTDDKLKTKYLNSIGSEMNELYKEKREIQNSSLNNSEKYKEVRKIQQQINDLSKKALSNYEDVSSYSNYGKVADKEYYLNSKNEWTKVDEEEQEALDKLNMSNANKNIYYKSKVKIGVIKNDKSKDSTTKHQEINNLLINSNLKTQEKAYLYGKYYSSEETINSIVNAGINFNEFLKYDMQDFKGDFNTKTGKTISGSREKRVINYVNSLNLSVPQKALLIKMEYKSYKKYDKQIAEYVNSQNISFLDKAQILKKANFTSFDKQIINYVNSQNMTVAEKTEILKKLGFTVRNGRVY